MAHYTFNWLFNIIVGLDIFSITIYVRENLTSPKYYCLIFNINIFYRSCKHIRMKNWKLFHLFFIARWTYEHQWSRWYFLIWLSYIALANHIFLELIYVKRWVLFIDLLIQHQFSINIRLVCCYGGIERPHMFFIILMNKTKDTLICLGDSMFFAMDLILLERG